MAASGGLTDMDIEEIYGNEEQRKKVKRCSNCQRMTRGHEGRYGSKCELMRLTEEELRDDDIKKIKEKEPKKTPKRKGSQNEETEDAKKEKLEQEVSRNEKEGEEERMRKAQEQNEKFRKKVEERKKIEIENMKMSNDLYKGARNKNETANRASKEECERYENWRSGKNPSSRMEKPDRREKQNWQDEPRHTNFTDNNQSSTPRKSRPSKRMDERERSFTPRRPISSKRMEANEKNSHSGRTYDSRRRNEGVKDARRSSPSRRMEGRKKNSIQRRPSCSHRMDGRVRHDQRRSHSRRSTSGSRRSSRSHRSISSSRRVEELATSMVHAMARVNENDDRKIDPVPMWEETTSFEGWKKELMIWSRAKGRQERKTQLLVEYLKKETTRKGLKELVINEFVENEDFKYESPDSIQFILDKIKVFIDESKWNKTVKLVKDFKEFKQNEDEKNKDFVTRFSTMETRMKNAGSELPKMWMAAELVSKSKMNGIQKHNILSTVNTEDNPNILKDMKKKLRDLDGCENDGNKRTFYMENRTPNRNFSRERNQREEDDGRKRGFSGDRRNFSRDRNNKNRNYSRDKRSSSRGRERSVFQKDGQTSNYSNTPKRTYHVTLKIDNKKSIFENEVQNKALVDSGCPELVAGLSWLRTYQSSKGIEFSCINRKDVFQMGNTVFNTIMFKRIPVKIGNHEEVLEVGIIDTEIPLLISRKKLREWGGKIDFEDNTLHLKSTGETIQLEVTSTGHLVMNLGKDLKNDKEEAIQQLFLMKKEKKYGMKEVKKLHRIFGHPTEEKMKRLMNDAGLDDPNISRILKKIHENCRICTKYRKKESRPRTAFPKSRSLNEAVSLDLKPLSSLLEDPNDKRHIVYMMDEFSRMTIGTISKSKEAEEVAKIVLDQWCLKGMGYPKGYFFSDNGSEFKGNLIEAVAKKTGIKVKLTPSYSAWSNGGIERKHGAIDITIKKMMEDDSNMKIEDALTHAVWARNMEIGRFGFSPYQIAYGQSPFLPGISDGTVLTDQSIPQEDVVRRHFINQEKARIEMRKADANNRLKEGLNSRIQPNNDTVFEHDDQIIYLNKDNKWDGPAKVITKESKTLHILQNGTVRKIATCNARPWNEEIYEEDSEDDIQEELNDVEYATEVMDDGEKAEVTTQEVIEVDIEKDEIGDIPKEIHVTESVEHLETIGTETEIEDSVQEETLRPETRPKRGSRVKYRLKESNEFKEANVKHVGKKSSRKKNVCWLEDISTGGTEEKDFEKEVGSWSYILKSKVMFQDGNKFHQDGNIFQQDGNIYKQDGNKVLLIGEKSVERKSDKDMESYGVFLLQRKEPVQVLATLVHPSQYNDPEVKQAMELELEKWIQFQAYEVVDDEGQDRIDGRWAINKKEEHDGLKVNVKARYCLRGFKEEHKPRSDSPTVDRVSTKLLYAIAGNEGWRLESIDVTSAFLQGSDLDREIFVKPPKEAHMDGFLWRMKKAAYGLYDASRRWWAKVMEVMLELGGRTLVGDESLIYFHKEGKLLGLISLHVDDFQGAGSELFFRTVMDPLSNKFKISKREIQKFRFTGVDVEGQENGDVQISQESYVEALEKINIKNDDNDKRSLNREEFKLYRGLVGKLTWLSEMTRPDLSYDTLELAGHNKDATVASMRKINKTVDKAKKTKGVVKYSRIGTFSDLKILAISDGGLNRMEDRTLSVMGKTLFLSNQEETRVSPLLWKSKTIQTVCKSAKTAETRACDKTMEDGIYLARCVHEIYTGERGEGQIPVQVVTDSQSLLDSLESTRQVEEKLIRPLIKWMKQMLDSKAITNIRWCDTCVCVSDAFTKPGSKLNQTLVEIFKTGKMIDLSYSTKR